LCWLENKKDKKMSVFKFTLTEEHIKLLKQLKVTNNDGAPCINSKKPFGNSEFYQDMCLILDGKTKEVGPDDEWDVDCQYTIDQKTHWDKLLEELTDALDIVLYTGTFEPGKYVTRTYDRNWIKQI